MQEIIERLIQGENLTSDQIKEVVDLLASGQFLSTQLAAFLVALKKKGETPQEIAYFAKELVKLSIPLKPKVEGRLVDTCGTGGDAIKTFNVSTLSALVAAGAGAKVAKHGNRSVTSKFGSADLLEKLGVRLALSPEQVRKCIEQIGIGFIFAPSFHPVMKNVAQVRKELGIRTIFNLMGPLINPSDPDAQLLGVYDKQLVPYMAEVLRILGREEAIVVHSLEGMDEISVSGPTLVAWLKGGRINVDQIMPEDFGLRRYKLDEVRVASSDECVSSALAILNNSLDSGAKYDMVLVNSSAAIAVSGLARDFYEGMKLARQSIRSGAALSKLKELIRFSSSDSMSIREEVSNAT